uniref:Anaphase-promoting complex subunit 4 WD40 domain-containing protein n=1 Tax=Glycine max TaxID=3847 RepID=I1KSF8_SOYBN
MAEKDVPKLKLKPRRLKGHDDSTTCCIASRERSHLIVTSGDDGRVCWFDLRCPDVPQLVMDVSVEPVSSFCFKSGMEDMIYVSSGKEIKCFDVRLAAAQWKPLENYNYNKEEINKVVCNSKSSFVAAADDNGEVKIIDIRQQCLYKTLRAGHTSICSTVEFLPWRSWEVISGGLDSMLMLWDFSKGRPYKVVDFATFDVSSGIAGRCVNPAFVHAIAVPEVDMLDKLDKICAAARGDGAIDVINIETEMAATKSKSSSNSRKGSHSRSKDGSSSSNTDADQNGKKRLHLNYTLGGHTAAVSSLAFSLFGERGKFLISGGNDKLVKIWNWSCYPDVGLSDDNNNNILHLNIEVSRKVSFVIYLI